LNKYFEIHRILIIYLVGGGGGSVGSVPLVESADTVLDVSADVDG
jgi:hypothetical protein